MARAVVICVILLLQASCSIRSNSQDELLAQVYGKRLYASEVAKVIPAGSSNADSILAQNAYVERWIKERVMMHEAEKNIPADLEIDQLVEDYKSSLVLHQFEKMVVENSLDTVIPEAELNAYYDENKSQYLLESTIVRCRFIRISSDIPVDTMRQIEEYWEGKDPVDFENLLELCEMFASSYYLNDSLWYKLELIQQEMPEGSINENAIRSNKNFRLSNDDYYYFLKVFEIRDKKEIAPLTYIQEQASKVILHKRKIALLDKLREDLYDRASSRNSIKLFTQ